jgi:hypothetical protein
MTIPVHEENRYLATSSSVPAWTFLLPSRQQPSEVELVHRDATYHPIEEHICALDLPLSDQEYDRREHQRLD